MTTSVPTVALVGSWVHPLDGRRSTAGELAAAWNHGDARLSVFADVDPVTRERLAEHRVTCWPEGAFGRHFGSHEFDHVVLMIASRLDSILALGRAADAGCHVWLQDDVVDDDTFPIDAPTDWLTDVIGAARSVIVGSDHLAGVVRRVAPSGPPILVMPPAFPSPEPIVDVPGRVLALVGGDDSVRAYLADALSVSIVALDDDQETPDVRERRVLSARAGVEIRTPERGFASTTVTHMMARGVPTITTLGAHSPFATSELAANGLVVLDDVEHDELTARIVDHLRPILDDDREWLVASAAAKATASGWTWTDAADVLAQWIDSVDHLEPSTVRVVGAVAT